MASLPPGESNAGVPPQEDRSDMLFHDPVFTKSIGNFFADPSLVLQYHRHSGPSVFYDPSCINEQVFMQTRYNNTVLDPSKMSGSNFNVAWSDVQNQCFHIIKTYTHPSGQMSTMAAYALCNEQLIQAPDLHTLITSRLSNGLSNLRTAYSKMQELVKFTPAQGYVWELPRNPNAPQPPNEPPFSDPNALPGSSVRLGGDVKSLATQSVAGGAAAASSVKGSTVGDAASKAAASARIKGKPKKNKLIQATHVGVLRHRILKMITETAAREHVVLEPIPTLPETSAPDADTTANDDKQTTAAAQVSSLLPARKKKVKRDRDRDSDAGGSMGGDSTVVRKKRKTNKGDKEGRKQRSSSVVSGN